MKNLPHIYCEKWDRLQIHHNPDRDKALTESEWVRLFNAFCVNAMKLIHSSVHIDHCYANLMKSFEKVNAYDLLLQIVKNKM